MLTFPPSVRVFLATQPVDGRKGAYGLAAMVRSVFGQDPLNGNLYVFFTRRSDRVRVLYWDRSGFALWTKKLERGCFAKLWRDDGAALSLTASELQLFIEGCELLGRRRLSPEQVVPKALADRRSA